MEYDQEFYQALVFVIAHALVVLFGLGYVISGLIGSSKNPDLNTGELKMERLYCYRLEFRNNRETVTTSVGVQERSTIDTAVENTRSHMNFYGMDYKKRYLGCFSESDFEKQFGSSLGQYKTFKNHGGD